MTRRMSVVERDPWEALIVADDLPQELLYTGFEPGEAAHPLTVVLGTAGGVGASLVASGIALAIVGAGQATALAEFDLERGDLAGAWGVPPERSIDDLTSVIDELVPGHVEMVCHPHVSGVWLLLSPRRANAGQLWDADATRLLLRSTRILGDVVVDAGASLGPHVEEACHQAARIVMVAAPTLAGARRTRALNDVLDAWSVTSERRLIVNRGVGRSQMSVRAFARAVGRATMNDLATSVREAEALESGRWPTARGRRHRMAATIEALVQEWMSS